MGGLLLFFWWIFFTKQRMLSGRGLQLPKSATYPAFPFPFLFLGDYFPAHVLLVDILYKATDAQREGIAVA